MNQLPSEFGVSTVKQTPDDSVYSKYLIYDPLDQQRPINNDSHSSDSEDSDDELNELPITHSFPLPTVQKPINSLIFTSSGNKLYTATTDSLFNVYDFQSLNTFSTSPSSHELYETHQVIKLDISSSLNILALPNDSSFKTYSPDLKELNTFRNGDKYIYDVKQTNGHTDTITDGCWYNDQILTSSNDSTFRIWDSRTGKQKDVNFIKNSKGRKVNVSKVVKTSDLKSIIAADDNDRITLWDSKSKFNRPLDVLQLEDQVTSIVSNSNDPNVILVRTRANDLKLFDLRNLKAPLIQRLNFPTELNNSQVAFQGDYVLAGETFDNPTKAAKLHILDKSDLMDITTLQFDTSITDVQWSQRTNQIALAQANGNLKILFNPVISKNGILTSINNKPKKRHFDENDDLVSTSAKQVGYNMAELAQLNKSKKRNKKSQGDDEEPKQKFIWGTTDSSKI